MSLKHRSNSMDVASMSYALVLAVREWLVGREWAWAGGIMIVS
jgi:hypothetical protein